MFQKNYSCKHDGQVATCGQMTQTNAVIPFDHISTDRILFKFNLPKLERNIASIQTFGLIIYQNKGSNSHNLKEHVKG